MSRTFFASELEGVATFWRIERRDGVTLGFSRHDRDLRFDGVLHRAAPGMLPSAIRRSSDLSQDSAEMEGALSHDTITQQDLADGRYDGAQVAVGAVDWETLENAILYRGAIGTVSGEAGRYAAQLQSAKAALDTDPVPRTSPTCRARFCGPGCTLSPARFTVEATVTTFDADASTITAASINSSLYAYGTLTWLDGPQVGLSVRILQNDEDLLILERPPAINTPANARVRLRQGCDHTLATCADRFGNAINFQGEPFLPGNDLLTRTPFAQ
ncbi:hypothetical protein HME9302_02229 [Alteripontixanthobacter maritimus]|uniref:Bacteriophage phiJL001 Gp84 C-terminal domain-containing protein n=1 Tax=Alteripontixanthobacter maritimus TaxID=2161824 RepID=A0A369Q952_9SPHN|nr:DUF2163 domain-containing protein [Alteripontixanthobacter maritimus]RDC61012.1 hypothetical protein HME9302_02229 [Alteripontixanthobacter maritimus]